MFNKSSFIAITDRLIKQIKEVVLIEKEKPNAES